LVPKVAYTVGTETPARSAMPATVVPPNPKGAKQLAGGGGDAAAGVGGALLAHRRSGARRRARQRLGERRIRILGQGLGRFHTVDSTQ
jgi:hypothetical protein